MRPTRTLAAAAVLAALAALPLAAPTSAGRSEGPPGRITLLVRISERQARVTGTVTPVRAGERVRLRLLRGRVGAHELVEAWTVATDAEGRYAARLRVPSAGACRLTARTGPELGVGVDFAC